MEQVILRPIVKPGMHWVVVACVTSLGEKNTERNLISDYLDELFKNNPDSHASVIRAMENLALNGPPRNEDKYKNLSGRIHELKVKQCRLIHFKDENYYIFTNGFNKKTQKTPPKHISTCQKHFENFQAKKTSNRIIYEPYQYE